MHIGYLYRKEGIWFRRNQDNSVSIIQYLPFDEGERSLLALDIYPKTEPIFEVTISKEDWEIITEVLIEEKTS